MGMKGLTRAKYFVQLLGEGELEMESEDESDDGNDEQDSSDGEEILPEDADDENLINEFVDEDQPSFPALLPLHREVHLPLIHLPNSIIPNHSIDDDTGTLPNELLMSLDVSEDNLDLELQEEMDLDEEDMMSACEYEAQLWKQVGEIKA